MRLDRMLSGNRKLFWLITHLLIGVSCIITSFVLIFWLYFVLFSNYKILIGRNFFKFFALLSYIIPFELLGRMAHTSPYIPLELSKYFLSFFSLLFILINHNYSRKWIIILFLVSIALIYDYSNQRHFFDIINNYFGLLALILGVALCSTYRIDIFWIQKYLYLILLAIVPSLIFTFIKTPSFEDITFNLSANFETSGGAATNQVSTIFGLGFFIIFYFFFNKISFTSSKILDILIGISFLARALLTFSRGGVIVALLGALLLFLLKPNNFNVKNMFILFFVTITSIFTFNILNQITGGTLLLRYQGETEGTYKYGVEKDLNKITSSRSQILYDDFRLWLEYPISGVGVGASNYMRDESGNKVASHIEFSRMLAEHGLLGVYLILSLLTIGFQLWRNMLIESWRIILFLLYLLGMLTAFHNGMRTFVTPLLISISSIGLFSIGKQNAQNTIHRGS